MTDTSRSHEVLIAYVFSSSPIHDSSADLNSCRVMGATGAGELNYVILLHWCANLPQNS